MNKAYSNKALPSGTVLREWRLEEVLGVGGFGIVYKARGIYFDELVAIKEYFPSSISERDDEDTVVPIDSEAEEVHALGLKKFVEEAKLLWNLSTPTRHPNIVSVRSLFEIHGTAYMVMDFEDGISLSRMLKQGRRFNERSLWGILRPIAEGLDRAHRVGVLHRDIKPPNILINEDNRPVLIDFGSARFEAAEATSTKVTFHTPPYAAIEQYVKTYEQGPWTDIYALGVVMYECVTGEKPPEVLERLHAGLGKPLAQGKWPGYSKHFLAGIDTAMTVKPDERPQSIPDWLAMFGKTAGEMADEEGDDEATRFYAQQVETEEIVPVPPTPDVDIKAPVETGVPADPKEVEFKRAGEETGSKKKKAKKAEVAEESVPDRGKESVAAAKIAAEKAAPPKEGAKAPFAKPKTPVLVGGAAVLLAAIAGGVFLLGGGQSGQTTSGQPAEINVGAPMPVVGQGSEPAGAENAVLDGTQNIAAAETAPTGQSNSVDEIRAEKAKAAAAEAQLAALRKAQAKAAAQAQGMSGPSTASLKKPKTSTTTTQAEEITETPGTGVSPAKVAQFYSIVDDARGMAKKVMRSSNSQNAQLARNYDGNLKTLRDSMRGISSNKEADRLIAQAKQTRAYVQFLANQSQ